MIFGIYWILLDVSNSVAAVGVAVIFWIGCTSVAGENLLRISCQHLRNCPIRLPQLLSICPNLIHLQFTFDCSNEISLWTDPIALVVYTLP